LREEEVTIGSRFRIGSAELEVTEPRLPCFKLGIKLGRAGMVKRFLESGRTGFYLAIVHPGELGAGDAIAWYGRPDHEITVADLVRLASANGHDHALLERVLSAQALPASWRRRYERAGRRAE
jgi:MOSC domain-containing protein YiiM